MRTDPYISVGKGGYSQFIKNANTIQRGREGYVDAAMGEARKLAGYTPPITAPRGSLMFPGGPSARQNLPSMGRPSETPPADGGIRWSAASQPGMNRYENDIAQWTSTGALPKGWSLLPPPQGIYPAVMPKPGHIFIYAPDGSRHEVPAVMPQGGV